MCYTSQWMFANPNSMHAAVHAWGARVAGLSRTSELLYADNIIQTASRQFVSCSHFSLLRLSSPSSTTDKNLTYIHQLHKLERSIQGGGGLISPFPTRKEINYIPHILWNVEVHYHIHNSPPPVPTLAKSIHSSAHHTFDKRSLFPSWPG